MEQGMSNAEKEQLSMAAVGRQFMDLSVKNEALRTDLNKLMEMYNVLRKENEELKNKVSTEKEIIEA